MGRISDIMAHVSSETLRSKLTLNERAALLIDIVSDDFDTYDIMSDCGKWVIDNDIVRAMSDLVAYDERHA